MQTIKQHFCLSLMNKEVLNMYKEGLLNFNAALRMFYRTTTDGIECSDGLGKLVKRKVDDKGFAKVFPNTVFNATYGHFMGKDKYERYTNFIKNYDIKFSEVYGVAYVYDMLHAETLNKALDNEVPMIVKSLGNNPSADDISKWLSTKENKGIVYKTIDLREIGKLLI